MIEHRSTWLKGDTSVGKFKVAKSFGGDFDRRKTWTREGEPEPRYPGLPMFLWGVTAGVVLGACLVGLMNSLHL